MSNIQPFILEIVRRLCKDRKVRKIEPTVAIHHNVIEEVVKAACEALDLLVSDNVIGRTENINGIKMYFPISKEGKELKQKLEKGSSNDNINTPVS